MSEIRVVEHRPPMRRIEIGSSVPPTRGEVTEAVSGVGPTERDRVWRLVEHGARDECAGIPACSTVLG